MRVLATVIVLGLISSVGCAACENCQNCRHCRACDADLKKSAMSDHEDLGIRIESARYGRDDTWVDVTPQVRGLLNGDTLVFPRDLHATFNVDPVTGRMKYVDMVIIIDGRVVEMTVGDSLHVTPLRLRAAGTGRSVDGSPGPTTRPQ